MAKNILSQTGQTVRITAPAGGVTSGVPLLIGQLFVVPLSTAPAGSVVEAIYEGQVTIAKETPLTIAAGDALFWDATNKHVDKSSAKEIGFAMRDAASADATVDVILVPTVRASAAN